MTSVQLQLSRLYFFTCAYIAFAAAWLVRTFGASKRAPMAGESHVDAAWLTDILRKARLLSDTSRVTSASVNAVDANRGFASVVRRVAVVVDNGAKPGLELFMKRSHESVTGRKDVIVGGWCREATFLSTPELVSLPAIAERTRAVIHASSSPWLGEYTILMNDANRPPFSATGLNFLFGNQIWGHDGKKGDDAQILDVLERTWLAGARIHAVFFNDRAALAQMRWLRGSPWLVGEGQMRWQLSLATAQTAWRTMQRKFGPQQSVLRFDERLRRLMARSIEGSTWERFQHDLQNNAVGLCHGDFHASNMLYSGQGANFQLHMFDWSEVGVAEPAADIGQMVISDIPAALHSRLRPLLRSYHEKLGAPAEYTLARLEADFGRATMSRWVYLTALMCNFEVPAPLLQYFHDQLLSFANNFADLENGTYYLNGMVSLMVF
jgi:hypothetical protein